MNDQDTLARTIWGEMRSGGYLGMQAVANVIVNRAKKGGWYGSTISDVCMKNYAGVYQFDCNDPNDPNFDKCANVTVDDPQFSQAMQIAGRAVDGSLPDVTKDSLNYYTKTVPTPRWAIGKTPAIEINNTLFFNNID